MGAWQEDWQVAQGHACGCYGLDDMCVCQNANEPWRWGLGGKPPPSREQELERRVRELEGAIRTLELQQQTDRETIRNLRAALCQGGEADTGHRDRSNVTDPGKTSNPTSTSSKPT